MPPLTVSSAVESRRWTLRCKDRCPRCVLNAVEGALLRSIDCGPRTALEPMVELDSRDCQLRIRRPPRVDALVLRVALSVDTCARVQQIYCCFRSLRPADALCRAGRKRTGLKTSRCARTRRSNARPLSWLGCTQAVLALTMLVRLCAAQASDHAWRARTASLGRAAVGVVARGRALGSCGSVALMHLMYGSHGSTRPIEVALGRCEGGCDGARARCGAVEARQACCPELCWPGVAGRRLGWT